MKGKKSVGSSWAYKEKINSLVYRIVDKILIGSEYENVLQPFNRIKTIAEQLVLLLDFPEIMPLWEKISLLNDQELKDYYADKFVRVVLQDNKHQIFDSDFVLDVISNFIVNSPEICFEKSKELLKYVSY